MNNDLGACAAMNLRKATRMIAQFYDQRLQPSGLRTTQFTMLASLERYGPVAITKLADKMGMDRTTLTRNIRLLERDGLVAGQAGEDARVRMLSLSKKGMIALRETRPYWEIAQSEFLKKFGKRRWQNLRGELNAISQILTTD